MTKPIWTEIDFRLSVVQRWQVMPTIRKQSVAEHVHNVVKIAERLALDVLGWGESRDYDLLELMQRAAEHDDLEAIIGDPPSYTKPFVSEESMAAEFGDLMRDPRHDDKRIRPDIKFILKAADYIDAMIFLRTEISMGNRTVVSVLRDLEQRFKQKCKDYGDSVERRVEAEKVVAAYIEVVDTMFNQTGQLTIEGFRFK